MTETLNNAATLGAPATPLIVQAVIGSVGSPVTIAQSVGVVIDRYAMKQTIFVVSSSGTYSLTANPQISPGLYVGQTVTVIGTSNSNAFTFIDGAGLELSGPALITNKSQLELLWDGNVWSEVGRSATAAPSVQNFRLTTQSGVPVSIESRSSQSTIYLTPYNGNQIALYNGTTWDLVSSAEVSLALSGLTTGALYDVFAYYSSGVVLELSAWANNGQAVEDATNATPIVITAAAHGLSNGDQVYIDKLAGNLAANGTWIVSNVATDTFELTGSVGSGAYTAATGFFNARTAAGIVSMQDGIYVKSADKTRRLVGNMVAAGATTTEDSYNFRYLSNFNNTVLRDAIGPPGALNAYGGTTPIPWNNSATETACNFVVSQPQNPIIMNYYTIVIGGNSLSAVNPFLDGANQGSPVGTNSIGPFFLDASTLISTCIAGKHLGQLYTYILNIDDTPTFVQGVLTLGINI